ncbi:MAG: anaerobic ribonucleoside-triphosphate reductase activating protein [Candidatus Pacearchaeota archaeon]
MKIKYIEKTTLVDYPDRIGCTLFLFGCNFRCGFCYNPELVIEEKTRDLDEEEILNFLEKRKKILEGVTFTGGEPLTNLEKEFLKKIKEKGYLIKIDTNGSFPEKLKEIIEENLVDYIAMDIKGKKEDYQKITSSKIDIEKIEESIKIISEMKEYEFRTTILESIHKEDYVLDMLKWIYFLIKKRIKRYALQGFKNYGKFIDENYKKEKNTSEDYLKRIRDFLKEKNFAEEIIIRI